MIKVLFTLLLPVFAKAQYDTLPRLIPISDTSKNPSPALFIKGYEVWQFKQHGDTALPGTLINTVGANKKPIGKPYIKTGAGIPINGFLWADLWPVTNSLNASDAAKGLTITGNTMQGNPPQGWALVRSIQPASQHTEFYINYLDNANIGLASLTKSLTAPLGQGGFCYDASGNKESLAGASHYGIAYKQGDYVDMYLINGVLSFKVNGISQGPAFAVPEGLYVCLGTSQKTIITVKFSDFMYE